MALSFSMRLTAGQQKLLLAMAFGKYVGDGVKDTMLPDYATPHFVTTGKVLCEKGLASHDNNRIPTWMATDLGVAVANQIAAEARQIVAMERTRKEVKPKTKQRTSR